MSALAPDLQALLGQLGPAARPGAPLRRHTSYKIGGPADIFVLASTRLDLVRAVDAAERLGVPWRIIGAGSNLLIADEGVEGLVIKTTARSMRILPAEDGAPLIEAEAGCLLAAAARRAAAVGLAGLEWAGTIPGTVGAAVVNNSGAFGSCIAEHLAEATLYLPGHGERRVSAAELGFDYRTSRLKTGEWRAAVLQARFRMTPAEPSQLLARMTDLEAQRLATQPLGPSVGSIFRNPPGEFAGALIERAGLKGIRAGLAQVSELHANFIVNLGGASAAQVLALVQRAQRRVWERERVWLAPEIELVGRWDLDQVRSLYEPPP